MKRGGIITIWGRIFVGESSVHGPSPDPAGYTGTLRLGLDQHVRGRSCGIFNIPATGTVDGRQVFMMVKPAVSFENVSMAFGRHILFENLNLDIAPGQVVGIQGPSGTGKSTLLKMAAGLIRPVKGRVRVHVRPLGYVFQEPRLLGWYTARENVSLALEAAGMSVKTAKQTALRCLKDLDLAGFEKHYPRELSGGMNQRISIAGFANLKLTPLRAK